VYTQEDLLRIAPIPGSIFHGAPTNALAPPPSILLPSQDVALLLLHFFESNLYHMCPIVHLSSIKSGLNNFFTEAVEGRCSDTALASLLLAIFGLAAHFYKPSRLSLVAASEHDTMQLTLVFSKNALNLLDYRRRIDVCSLEDVQAYSLLVFVFFHLDGNSGRARLMSTMAMSTARELGLHRLDLDGSGEPSSDLDVRTLVDKEIMRRVFWHIVASDWYVSTFSHGFELYGLALMLLQAVCHDFWTSIGNILHSSIPILGSVTSGLLR
jgi:hypothetical protein